MSQRQESSERTRKPRVDASMGLLRAVTSEAMEPEYRSTSSPRRTPWITSVAVMLVTVLLTMAVLETFSSRDVEAQARTELLKQVEDARTHQAVISAELASVNAEIQDLSSRYLVDDAQREQNERASLLAGATAVTGPGVVFTASDAPNATSTEGRVLDSDLSMLVNGLFEAGAEAVAINGHRVTTQTPIRVAGAAITLDYVSLSAPYEVEAIGGPSLQGRFARTQSAAWWQYLTSNYGLRLDVRQAEDDLMLPADAGLAIRWAEEG